MSEFEGHTKEPWHVGEVIQSGPDGSNLTIEICNYEMFLNQRREYIIAHVFDGETDATLIAAAPRLLRQNKKMIATLKTIADNPEHPLDESHLSMYEVKRMAKKTLAGIGQEITPATVDESYQFMNEDDIAP